MKVLQIVGKIHLVGNPVHLLLHFIGLKGPVVFEGFVVGAFF